MSAKCFLCKRKVSFHCVKLLCRHIFQDHRNETEVFRCGEDNCFKSYNCLNTFKKHLRNQHGIPNENRSKNSFADSVLIPVTSEAPQSPDAPNEEPSAAMEESSEPVITLSDLEDSVFCFAETFVAKLYSKSTLPRNHVQTIIDDLAAFFSHGPLSLLKDHVVDLLESAAISSSLTSEVEKMFLCLEDPFAKVKTEYLRFKNFSESNDYIAPESYEIGKKLVKKSQKDNSGKAEYVKVCGQFIPLEKVLKRFLEQGDTLAIIQENMVTLQNMPECMLNVIQGPIWKEKLSSFKNSEIVLPLLVYYDDFEPNDVLGPHSGKLGAVYTSIPCLPSPCLSTLDNIFLTLLFDSHARKEFGNQKTFGILVEELCRLENKGVVVKTPSGENIVYFVLLLLTGDNLALQQLLGFVESFAANHYCRFCVVDKAVARKLVSENEDLLRNRENYARAVALNDPKLTGVKEECVFTPIPSFHPTENPAVDLLHDIVEGVGHTTTIFLLDVFISKGYFTLENLNFRMDMFSYGPIDSANKPTLLSSDFATKSKLKMTGREMLCFLRMLGVLIGDRIPLGDSHWKLYLYLREIMDVAMARSISSGDVVVLKERTTKFLKHFLELDPDHEFKPKEHFLTHYHRVAEKVVSLNSVSCWRYEAKHKPFKESASVTTSRRNLPLTLAVKHQLSLCYRFKTKESIIPDTEIGPGYIHDLSQEDQFLRFRDVLPDFVEENSFVVNWVVFNGSRYCLSNTVVLSVEDHTPVFAHIRFIIMTEKSKDSILFVCQKYRNVKFDTHVHGYHVEITDDWICSSPSDLLDPLPLFASQTPDLSLRVILKYRI